VHGYLVTHAGVARVHWPWMQSTPQDQLDVFLHQTGAAWRAWVLRDQVSPLFGAGPGRGGQDAPVGGPLWLDWDQEFVDELPFPQLVGHTRGKTARRKDRSWCLDAAQTCAALVDPEIGARVIPI
jgi:hypothetical protein